MDTLNDLISNPEMKSAHIRTGRMAMKVRMMCARVGIRTSDEEGQALIEFAITLPVLLMLVTAIFIFGLTLSHYLMLLNATDIAARNLAISRGQTTDPCALTVATVEAAAPMLTPGSLSFSLNLNGTAENGTSCSSASTTTGAAGLLVQGSAAQVTVTFPCSLVVYGANPWPNCKLVAITTELVQ